jgi:hypothetical protein
MLWHAPGAWVKGESPSRRPSDTAWESYLGVVPPTLPVRPSLALCGKAGVNSMTPCCLLPYGLHVAPLERGRWNPRKRYGRQPCTRAGRRRDDRPVERVYSVTYGPVQPSPQLCHHPGHCSTIPTLWKPGTTRHHQARCCASYGLLSAMPSSQRTDGDRIGSSHATTVEAAPG